MDRRRRLRRTGLMLAEVTFTILAVWFACVVIAASRV